MTRRSAAALIVALGIGIGAAAARTVRQSSPASQSDRRLDSPRTLRDTSLFTPPDSPSAWAARAALLRRQIQVALGLWPAPEAAPLNAVVHGRVAREGYTVDRVFFESLPGHFVTGSLYRPVGRAGRLPAVLLPHGHWEGGRFNEASIEDVRNAVVAGAERFEVGGRYPLQAAAVQLARMGVISFLFDLEGYADSVQIPIKVAHGPDGRPKDSPAAPGLFFSADAESRLESIMGLQSWNARRALDFLASLPDVDPARMAVSGASGGGTQTFILGALDDRPVTIFPMVMVGTNMQGGCTCENADYLRIGSGNVEIASLWAPRPLGMTTADDWTKTLPETGFPAMQKLWAMLGTKDDVQVFPMPQFPHNYNYVSRAAMYAWMNKRLKLGLPEPIVEEDFKPLTREEATVWTADHPAPARGEAEERRVTSWWTSESEHALTALRPQDEASLDRYRDVVGGALAVMIGGQAPKSGDVTVKWGDTRAASQVGRGVNIETFGGWLSAPSVPAFTFDVSQVKGGKSGDVAVWVNAGGPRPTLPDSLVEAGLTVVQVNVLGTGEAEPTKNQMVSGPAIAPYTYGYNSPLIVQRVRQLLAALRFAHDDRLEQGRPAQESLTLTAQSPTEAAEQRAAKRGAKAPPPQQQGGAGAAAGPQQQSEAGAAAGREQRSEAGVAAALQPRVYLIGFGKDAGVWAALARAAAPELVDRAAIDTGGFRFSSITGIDDPAMLPGAVKYGDVPGFLALGTSPLWLAGEGARAPELVSAAFKAAGAPRAVTVAKESGAQAEAAAIRWLTTK
jgi:hypothetical protein